jgi:hypothetical protein
MYKIDIIVRVNLINSLYTSVFLKKILKKLTH